MSRRSYAGGALETTLSTPVSDSATSWTVGALVGWPTGLNGPFAAIINKGQTNEEKVLVGSASGGTLTIGIRGYDGTTARAHAALEPIRLVGTAIDLDEANQHVNATTGIHGLDVSDAVVGEAKIQSLSNKNISGEDNNIHDIQLVDSPQIDNAIGDEAAARAAADTLRYTKAEADAAFRTGAQVNTAVDAAVTAHEGEADPHAGYLTPTEGGNLYIPKDTTLGRNFGKLPLAYLPELPSDRYWESSIVSLAATDALPLKTLGTLVISNVVDEQGPKLLDVKFLCKGFTTNGTDGDPCRFAINLIVSGDASAFWLGIGGLTLSSNHRQTGNISVPTDGWPVTGHLRIEGNVVTITAQLEKISGTPNPTNSPIGGLSAVQLT